LEVNQDPLGQQAYLTYKDGEGEVWVKRMEDGSKAVGFFNRSMKEISVGAEWKHLGVYGNKECATFGDRKILDVRKRIWGKSTSPWSNIG